MSNAINLGTRVIDSGPNNLIGDSIGDSGEKVVASGLYWDDIRTKAAHSETIVSKTFFDRINVDFVKRLYAKKKDMFETLHALYFEVVKRVKSALRVHSTYIKEITRGLIDLNFSEIISEFLGKLRFFMKPFYREVEHFGFFDDIKNALNNVWKALINGVTSTFSTYIIEPVKKVFNDAIGFVSNTIDNVKETVGNIKTTVSGVADTVKTNVVGAFNSAISGVTNTVDDIKTKAGELGRTIEGVADKAKDKVVDAVKNISIVKSFTDFFDEGVFGSLKRALGWITGMYSRIMGFFRDLGGRMWSFIKKEFKATIDFFGKIKDLFEQAWVKFLGFAKWFGLTIWNGASKGFKDGLNGFLSVFATVKEWTTGTWGKVMLFLGYVGLKIKSVAVSFGQKVKEVFTDILGIFAKIANVISKFVTNPGAMLQVIIGVPLAWLARIIIFVLDLGPAKVIGLVFAWVTALLITIIQINFYCIIVVFGTIVFSIIFVLQVITGGAFSFLFLCENDPTAWYTQSGFDAGNLYKRFLLCFKPCSSGWGRFGSFFCKKNQISKPLFCPQQQIFGLYDDLAARSALSPQIFDKYIPDTWFRVSSLKSKKEQVVDGLMTKKHFIGACTTNLKNHDYLPRHICANLDHLDKLPPSDSTGMSTLIALCKQAYCTYKIDIENDQPIANLPSSSHQFPSFCGNIGPSDQSSSDGLGWKKPYFLMALALFILGTLVTLVTLIVRDAGLGKTEIVS